MPKKIPVKLILELRFRDGLSFNTISSRYRISKHSVSDAIHKAKELQIDLSFISTQSEEELYSLIFPEKWKANDGFKEPNYEYVHKELSWAGVTLKLLYNEYKEECRNTNEMPISYSTFSRGYHTYVGCKGYANHLEHKPGDAIQVDWSGPTMHYINPSTGQKVTVYLFVADMVASRLAYVEGCLNMNEQTWLNCHINMFKYYGGVTRTIIPDNLKTGVIEHPRIGEIVLTFDYEELASYYATAILPARVKAPRDKNSVENSVWLAAINIIAKLRHKEFYSFEDLQKAIREKLDELNNEPFQKRDGSRRSYFEEVEKAFLRTLPSIPFEVGTWFKGRVIQANCHVAFETNLYSCPYKYKEEGGTVDLKVSVNSVFIYKNGTLIKTHSRFPSNIKYKYRTDPADMPKESANLEWNANRFCSWALNIGPSTKIVIDKILESKPIIEQTYNSAKAVLSLTKKYDKQSIEAACSKALKLASSPRYRLIQKIIDDNSTSNSKALPVTLPKGLLRGEDYYSN